MDSTKDSPVAKVFEAAENDDLETVKMLIESAGVLPQSIKSSCTGETLLEVAMKKGNLDMLKYLVEKDSSLVNRGNNLCKFTLTRYNDPTVLEEAVTRGHLHMVKYLVKGQKDDIFIERYRSESPYYRNVVDLAVEKGHLNIVRYFIEERRVDPNTNRPRKRSYCLADPPLFAAARAEQHNITSYLIEDRKADLTVFNKEQENVLSPAVSNGDLDFIKNVLDVQKAQIDINWRDKAGRTLVYMTVLHDRIHVLRYLVEQKEADVNIPGGNVKCAPLLQTMISSNVEVFKYLVDHGADLEKKDVDGRTALHWVVNKWPRGSDEFCKHLLQRGANVKSKDNRGDTPLHIAIYAKHFKASKYLINFCGNVNEKNEDGETVLHFVAAHGDRKLMVYLVKEKHAQINVTREEDHWTPLHCAAARGHRKMCEYLIEQGADPRAKEKMGKTPAQVASNKALMNYIQNVAEVRSRRSVDQSFFIPAQPSASNQAYTMAHRGDST